MNSWIEMSDLYEMDVLIAFFVIFHSRFEDENGLLSWVILLI